MTHTRDERKNRRARFAADTTTVGVVFVLIAVAAAVGAYLNRPGSGVVLWAPAAPLFGVWLPHVGPGSAFAVLIAFAVIAWGPTVASRLSWRPCSPWATWCPWRGRSRSP